MPQSHYPSKSYAFVKTLQEVLLPLGPVSMPGVGPTTGCMKSFPNLPSVILKLPGLG